MGPWSLERFTAFDPLSTHVSMSLMTEGRRTLDVRPVFTTLSLMVVAGKAILENKCTGIRNSVRASAECSSRR
jgi:hypothetical protein